MTEISARIEQTDRTKLLAATIALLGWFALGTSLLRSVASAGSPAGLLRQAVLFSFWTNTAVALALTLPLVNVAGIGVFFLILALLFVGIGRLADRR